MAISKVAIAFTCCSLLTLTASAVTETVGLYKIEASYHRPDFSDRGINVMLSEIHDQLSYALTVKLEDGKIVTTVTAVHDGKTTYLEDMEPNFIVGEYCKGVQTPIGEYEAFTISATPKAQADYAPVPPPSLNIPKPPGTPALPPGFPQRKGSYKITTRLSGFEHLRGWDFKVDSLFCNIKNTSEEDSQTLITNEVSFDSKQLKADKKALIIDKTENGFGWVFTITQKQ